MKKHKVKILETFPVTHDVKCFRTEKPSGYDFSPGQATEVFLDHPDWNEEGRPFTFTNLPDEEYLEFIIKAYPEHDGVTKQIHRLDAGDHFLVSEVFGAINYQGEGLFIAGGAGITPFISIFRMIATEGDFGSTRLIFGNKTQADIILHDELKEMLGDDLTNVLSDESADGFRSGFITREMIVDHLKKSHSKVYLCGPPKMMEQVMGHLEELEVSEDSIVKEEM